MSYGWPLKPFDQQHPVRGFFCDPRIGDKGGKAFHFGVDVSAPDGTAVYAVEGGTCIPKAPRTSRSSAPAATTRTATGTSFRRCVMASG